MTREQHLDAIVAHLNNLLAVAEKRTPGEWVIESSYEIWSEAEYVCDCVDNRKANSRFIVQCPENAEAGWRATLDVLTVLRAPTVSSLTGVAAFVVESALNTILARFPKEIIQKPLAL